MHWWRDTIDAKWYAKFRRLPALPFFSFVRPDADSVEQSKEAFLLHGKIPTFTYSYADTFDVNAYRDSALLLQDEIRYSGAQSEIKELYLAKIDELVLRNQLIGVIQQKNDLDVHQYSLQLFGAPQIREKELLDEADHLKNKTDYKNPKKDTSSEKIYEVIHKLIESYNFQYVDVKMHTAPSVKVTHSFVTGRTMIHIPEQRSISSSRAERLLVHEIEVHVLRKENSHKTNIALVTHGLDNYITTDEGLALHFQQKLHDHLAVQSGFWDAYTVHQGMKLSFSELFEDIFTLKQKIESQKTTPLSSKEIQDFAWKRCLRVYRGMHHPTATGNIYVRDHIYRTGLMHISNYIEQHGEEALSLLFAGRIGIHHLPILQSLGVGPGAMPQMKTVDLLKKDA